MILWDEGIPCQRIFEMFFVKKIKIIEKAVDFFVKAIIMTSILIGKSGSNDGDLL